MTNTLDRVRALLAEWDRDEAEHLDRCGQHLPASLAVCADKLRAVLADGDEVTA